MPFQTQLCYLRITFTIFSHITQLSWIQKQAWPKPCLSLCASVFFQKTILLFAHCHPIIWDRYPLGHWFYILVNSDDVRYCTRTRESGSPDSSGRRRTGICIFIFPNVCGYVVYIWIPSRDSLAYIEYQTASSSSRLTGRSTKISLEYYKLYIHNLQGKIICKLKYTNLETIIVSCFRTAKSIIRLFFIFTICYYNSTSAIYT